MKFPCRRIVGASVIILMALGSFAPVRLTHAHVIQPPTENASPGHHHGHGHAHSHHHPHVHTHHGNGSSHFHSGSVVGPHTHFYLLGMEVVLPETPGDQQNHPRGPLDGNRTIEVGVIAQETIVLQQLIQVPDSPGSASLITDRVVPAASSDWKIDRATARSSPPLCDAARHERTGVLTL